MLPLNPYWHGTAGSQCPACGAVVVPADDREHQRRHARDERRRDEQRRPDEVPEAPTTKQKP